LNNRRNQPRDCPESLTQLMRLRAKDPGHPPRRDLHDVGLAPAHQVAVVLKPADDDRLAPCSLAQVYVANTGETTDTRAWPSPPPDAGPWAAPPSAASMMAYPSRMGQSSAIPRTISQQQKVTRETSRGLAPTEPEHAPHSISVPAQI
jgi:hypothetical protein